MSVSVSIDDIAGAWNDYLKSIHGAYTALKDLPARTGALVHWRIHIADSAKRDFGITILTDKGRRLDPYTNAAVGSLVFAEEAALTQFLLKFSS